MAVCSICGRADAASSRESQDVAEILHVEDGLVVVVADGAGGISGGRAAAGAVVEVVRALVAAGCHLHPDRLVRHLRVAESDLVAVGETTAAVVVVADDEVLGASLGDGEARIGAHSRWM
ncbi:MAG: hypothetical protein HY907_12400 [Deltaproteobacteria bacterium]|nr:hypothetical protein [Deltaproteobacteria bacterium]